MQRDGSCKRVRNVQEVSQALCSGFRLSKTLRKHFRNLYKSMIRTCRALIVPLLTLTSKPSLQLPVKSWSLMHISPVVACFQSKRESISKRDSHTLQMRWPQELSLLSAKTNSRPGQISTTVNGERFSNLSELVEPNQRWSLLTTIICQKEESNRNNILAKLLRRVTLWRA